MLVGKISQEFVSNVTSLNVLTNYKPYFSLQEPQNKSYWPLCVIRQNILISNITKKLKIISHNLLESFICLLWKVMHTISLVLYFINLQNHFQYFTLLITADVNINMFVFSVIKIAYNVIRYSMSEWSFMYHFTYLPLEIARHT